MFNAIAMRESTTDIPRHPELPIRDDRSSGSMATALAGERAMAQCTHCPQRHHACVASCVDDHSLPRLTTVVQTWRSVRRGEYLFRAGDAFQNVYAVRSGSFKTVVMQWNGRDHVTGFHHAGETIGLDGICTNHHPSDAVALEDSTVCVIPFHALEALCREVRSLQQYVHRLFSAEIVRESGMMVMLADMSAEQRLASFLLNFASRMQSHGYSGTDLRLRMTRAEIGSYLGMTLETVSRTFSRLQQDRLISVKGKQVTLTDKDRLDRL